MGAAAVLALVAVLLWAGRQGADALPRILEAVRDLGPWAAVAFIGLYAAATVAWVPGSILTLAAGALFGLLRGTAYTLMGATLGCALAFLVARHVARSAVERRLGGSPRLRAVDEAIGRQGAKVVLLLRLSPVFPFNALNYALGLTRVPFRRYVAASAVGMVPGTFLYVYAGHAAGQVAAGVTGAAPRGPGYWALLTVGLLATVAVTVLITRSARRALARDTSLEADDT
ncbi:MAG: TVP38/TMEM64 family protein [Gemmatimonadetes bacterium]|nr:TVP38/TMEM64 family protein [Gemmatimonadota bacterium]